MTKTSKLILSTIAALALNASADGLMPPSADLGNFCSNIACTKDMQDVANEFATYKTFPQAPNLAYSGSCWDTGSGLDPAQEQHGLYLFTTDSAGITKGTGSHSYMNKSNPWEGQTYQDIKAGLEKGGARFTGIVTKADQATLQYKYDTGVINHYFRTSDDQKTLIWLSEWVFENSAPKRIFCRLQQNP
jgi:hypothetical protein